MVHRRPLLFAPALLAVLAAAAGTAASAATPAIASRTGQGDDVKLYYLTAGDGPALVLLHGYTQTSLMWKPVIPAFAAKFRVIAPDLPGIGDSDIPADGIDMARAASRIHALVKSLGVTRASVVGHDIGLMVAYAYAAQYPDETEKLAVMDAFLPGVEGWREVYDHPGIWHFRFNGPTPEALVKGRERTYFEHFWNDFAADKNKSVPEADRRIYAAAYARANGMRAGFEYFKTFEQDAKDFAAFSATKLDMPFLVLTGEKASGTFLIDQMKIVATNVSGTMVKGSGHWLMEEATDQVIPAIVAFLK
jgi:pimeloyl-ACP methyl ester carboxylesterase